MAAGTRVRRDKIYLVGFMSVGKTTLAQVLARRLNWRVEDVDERIEASEGMTVAQIFATRGEPYFRAAEREVVRALLPLREVVVATGGGTFVDPENRAIINNDGVSIWLDLPFRDILDRLPADGRRPLAASRQDMERLFEMRRTAYQQAHLRLDAARARSEELAERVLDWLEH